MRDSTGVDLWDVQCSQHPQQESFLVCVHPQRLPCPLTGDPSGDGHAL